jgi:hypothetical protein
MAVRSGSACRSGGAGGTAMWIDGVGERRDNSGCGLGEEDGVAMKMKFSMAMAMGMANRDRDGERMRMKMKGVGLFAIRLAASHRL